METLKRFVQCIQELQRAGSNKDMIAVLRKWSGDEDIKYCFERIYSRSIKAPISPETPVTESVEAVSGVSLRDMFRLLDTDFSSGLSAVKGYLLAGLTESQLKCLECMLYKDESLVPRFVVEQVFPHLRTRISYEVI